MLTCEVNGSYTVVDCKHMSASSLNICLLVFILLHDWQITWSWSWFNVKIYTRIVP